MELLKEIKYNRIINRINNRLETSERRDFDKPSKIITYCNDVLLISIFVEDKIITVTNCLSKYGLCEDVLFKIIKLLMVKKHTDINFNDFQVKRNY